MRVIIPRLPWAGSIEQRATALAEQLRDEPGPLHLVAHSMGGLDARYWINHLGGAAKVSSLTTLATPHRGSPAADYICTHFSPLKLLAGVRALTTERLHLFNQQTPDQPEVIYRSYTATRPLHQLPWIVRGYGRYIQQTEGDNDSQVSIQSGAWGTHIATLPCDHFEMIFRDFWFNPLQKRHRFDPMPLYRDIGQWILTFEQNR